MKKLLALLFVLAAFAHTQLTAQGYMSSTFIWNPADAGQMATYDSLGHLGTGGTVASGTFHALYLDTLIRKPVTALAQPLRIDSTGQIVVVDSCIQYCWPDSTNAEDKSVITFHHGSLSWQVPSGGGNAWLTTGNAATNSGLNFLGTTDNASLSINTNSIKRIFIDSIGTTNILYANGYNKFVCGNFQPFSDSVIGMMSGDILSGHGAAVVITQGVAHIFGLNGASLDVGNNALENYVQVNGSYVLPTSDGTVGQVMTTNGSRQVSFQPITNTAWGLTGNAGTTDANFVGTTDANPLQFEVNNTFAGELDTTDTWNTSFGYESNDNNGVDNTAIGMQALYNNTSNNNTANGVQSLYYNTIGSSNTAIGASSLYYNTTGNNNTANGVVALSRNLTGNRLTGIGINTNVIIDGLTNATAIGATALVGQSNSVSIGDTTQPLYVGIGTAYPQARLDVEGTLKLTDGTQGAGKVLTSDASGNASWQAISTWLTNNYASLPKYASDAAAGVGGLITGNPYVSSVTFALTFKQ